MSPNIAITYKNKPIHISSLFYPCFLNNYILINKSKQINVSKWYKSHGLRINPTKLKPEERRNYQLYLKFLSNLKADGVTLDVTPIQIECLAKRAISNVKQFAQIPRYLVDTSINSKGVGFVVVSSKYIKFDTAAVTYVNVKGNDPVVMKDKILQKIASGKLVRIDEYNDTLDFEMYQPNGEKFNNSSETEIDRVPDVRSKRELDEMMRTKPFSLLGYAYETETSLSKNLTYPKWLVELSRQAHCVESNSVFSPIQDYTGNIAISSITVNANFHYKLGNEKRFKCTDGILFIKDGLMDQFLARRWFGKKRIDFSDAEEYTTLVYKIMNNFISNNYLKMKVELVSEFKLEILSGTLPIYDSVSNVALFNFKKLIDTPCELLIIGEKGLGKSRLIEQLKPIYPQTFFEDSDLYGYYLYALYRKYGNNDDAIDDKARDESLSIVLDNPNEERISIIDIFSETLAKERDFGDFENNVKIIHEWYFNLISDKASSSIKKYHQAVRRYMSTHGYVCLVVFAHSDNDQPIRFNPSEKISLSHSSDNAYTLGGRYAKLSELKGALLLEYFYTKLRSGINLYPFILFKLWVGASYGIDLSDVRE